MEGIKVLFKALFAAAFLTLIPALIVFGVAYFFFTGLVSAAIFGGIVWAGLIVLMLLAVGVYKLIDKARVARKIKKDPYLAHTRYKKSA